MSNSHLVAARSLIDLEELPPSRGSCAQTFLIRLAALHLTKNALALYLLLEDPESLIDIVVANEYPQMFSDRATAALGVEMS